MSYSWIHRSHLDFFAKGLFELNRSRWANYDVKAASKPAESMRGL
jgi:hypothetical protein